MGRADPGVRRGPGPVRARADRAAVRRGRGTAVAAADRLTGVPKPVRGAAAQAPGRPAGDRDHVPALPRGQGLGDHSEKNSMTDLAGTRDALGQSYAAIENLGAVLSPTQWRAQSLCPDWTARGVVTHLASVEHMLVGMAA